MTKISELPNSPNYPLRALAELRRKDSDPDEIVSSLEFAFMWMHTREGKAFWSYVDQGATPPIPASSIEDLRRAGMMPEPSITLEDYARCLKVAKAAVDKEYQTILTETKTK
jgi:hypothetical protein